MRILLVSFKGIGDNIAALPLLKALHARYPEERITVLLRESASAELFAGCPYVEPMVLKYRDLSLGSLLSVPALIARLRARKFDAVVTTFPSNRPWYNLFAFLTGARSRITHSYGYARLRTLAFLQNVRVPADPALHELEQNMRLLPELGIDPAGCPRDISLWLGENDRAWARAWLEERALDPAALSGIHPSINPEEVYKNWAPENVEVFARLMDWLYDELGIKSVVFAGPDETGPAEKAASLARSRPAVCKGAGITRTAALIERCSLFVNTDSGLGHVAAACGVPVVTVFGPANHVMTAPYGEKVSLVLPGLDCSPCYSYPYRSTRPAISCPGGKCLGRIDLERLKKAVRGALPERAGEERR